MDRGVAYVRDVRGGGAHYNNLSNQQYKAEQSTADNTRGRGAEQDDRRWASGERAGDWHQRSWPAGDWSHAGDWNQDSWDQHNRNWGSHHSWEDWNDWSQSSWDAGDLNRAGDWN